MKKGQKLFFEVVYRGKILARAKSEKEARNYRTDILSDHTVIRIKGWLTPILFDNRQHPKIHKRVIARNLRIGILI